MKKALHVFIALIAAAVLAAGAASAAENLKEITLGIIPTESSSSAMKGFEPFRADMEKALGIPVKLFIAPDYAGVIEAMRFNKVQIAWYGNKSAIDAVDRANGEVFAQFVDLDGTPGYYSYLITHRDSTVKNLDDALKNGKSLTFGIGDPQSSL